MVDLRCFHFQELQEHTKGDVFSICNCGRLSKDLICWSLRFPRVYDYLMSLQDKVLLGVTLTDLHYDPHGLCSNFL